MKTKAVYQLTVRGFDYYHVFVDGVVWGMGGLPEFIYGARVTWIPIPGTLDYEGKR